MVIPEATYYIKVIGYSGAHSTTCYTIRATATAITGCQSSYDVSTNGTMSGSAVIPFNTDIKGLISPSGDIDYYKFTITTGGTITVSLTTLPADYDLKLFNSAGMQVGLSENGSTVSETISYAAAAGVYYAQAYGYNNASNANSCYTLKVALGTATKVPIIAQDAVGKKIFSVYPNPAHSKININLAGCKGISEMALYDIHGRQVAVYHNPQLNSQVDGKVLSTKLIKE